MDYEQEYQEYSQTGMSRGQLITLNTYSCFFY